MIPGARWRGTYRSFNDDPGKGLSFSESDSTPSNSVRFADVVLVEGGPAGRDSSPTWTPGGAAGTFGATTAPSDCQVGKSDAVGAHCFGQVI